MSTISLRLTEEEDKLIKEYVKVNELTLSSFVKNLVFEKIEEDLQLDEERILQARAKIEKEKAHDHEDVWKRLGV